MSFSPEWLALREPADHRARSSDLMAAVSAFASGIAHPLVADLAGGTGSTFRSLAPMLPAGQRWRLFDFDENLLDTARVLLAGQPVDCCQTNLVTDLASVFDPKPDLVVTSAFLDLVSSDWLDALIGELAARKLPFYAALSYDGRASIDPPNALDKAVIDGVNRHQRTDKGFGPALGPEAASETVRRLTAAGYSVRQGRSDWLLQPEEGLMQSMIIDGWAQAVYEMGETDDQALLDWASWHLTRIAEGGTEIMVGHVDLFAIPNG